MGRGRHPNKEIENAIRYAEKNGWTYKHSGGSSHAWGRMYCPLHAREGHQLSIWATPSNPYAHARMIRRVVDKCLHEFDEESIQ